METSTFILRVTLSDISTQTARQSVNPGHLPLVLPVATSYLRCQLNISLTSEMTFGWHKKQMQTRFSLAAIPWLGHMLSRHLISNSILTRLICLLTYRKGLNRNLTWGQMPLASKQAWHSCEKSSPSTGGTWKPKKACGAHKPFLH